MVKSGTFMEICNSVGPNKGVGWHIRECAWQYWPNNSVESHFSGKK